MSFLSYKLYCPPAIQNSILSVIHSKFDNFYFVRYCDKYNHLRIRFFCINSTTKELFNEMDLIIKLLLENKLIWKWEISNYNFEIKRYSKRDISENIFILDSQFFLNEKKNNEKSIDYYIHAIKRINLYFDVFKIDLIDRVSFTQKAIISLEKEFKITKNIKKQIGINYRSIEIDVNKVFNRTLYEIKLLNLIQTNDFICKNDEISSYIHMSLNRLFITDQRLNEYISYQFYLRHLNKIKYFNSKA